MLCIVKQRTNDGTIVGWIIATDFADATRQAHGAGEHALADFLYRMDTGTPTPGKHRLPSGTAEHEYWLLV